MNTAIRERADQLHAEALAHYALALDDKYQAAIAGCSKRHTQLLRWNALALLGSPYHQVNHIELSDAQCDWLLVMVRTSDAELLQVVSRMMQDHARTAVEGFSRRNATIKALREEVKSLKGERPLQDDGSNRGHHKLFKT